MRRVLTWLMVFALVVSVSSVAFAGAGVTDDAGASQSVESELSDQADAKGSKGGQKAGDDGGGTAHIMGGPARPGGGFTP